MDSLIEKDPCRTSSRRASWLGALPLLARYSTRTMPWLTLMTGCLAGTAFLTVMAHLPNPSHLPLSEGTVRVTFLPAIAALTFVTRCPFRPLTQATPVPAWLTPAAQLVLALPILAATYWLQLRIMTGTFPPRAVAHQPAVYTLTAQLVGWCVIAAAAAACVDRSRFSDLGGAVAMPISLAVIGIAWYLPASHKFLANPPASAGELTIAWYVVAAVAFVCTGAAMRDQWHRYARRIHRRSR